ncbi:FtsH protease activity modulator HflK [Oceanidesulfovibrio indonesiensis]|uniref:Protein HflK n=1 Tax=Oceanidesulfovibrio indonesiensis TaxID=54767 RepID=A0A7M3MIV1_9BACT|nr:FtsH protease activity modulator HflK [Oceanidesulfovibrio indonesiensis]TVM19714.1 FtsH protease activity modulator HflK [Oceanidesulfovibrio indonesiensis]
MNWDWDKLSEKKRRQNSGGGGPEPARPDWDSVGEKLEKFKNFKFPFGKTIIALVLVAWLVSGFYIVNPGEVGVVLRFGEYHRTTTEGPHLHYPFPIESVMTPNVEQVRRVAVGVRGTITPGQDESSMLTGDENIVNVEFVVQYKIKDAKNYLFNVAGPDDTVKSASETAMREVIGYSMIDAALTDGKFEIQNETRDLLQGILDSYQAGLQVIAVKLQDVTPPREVVDAFKDVASAREDRERFINEAEAYRNDIIPTARGRAAEMVNQALAFKESEIRKATGEAERFLSVLAEYQKAEDVTRRRLYLEAMEEVYSNPSLEKIIMGQENMERVLPLLPLGQGLGSFTAPQPQGQTQGGQQ